MKNKNFKKTTSFPFTPKNLLSSQCRLSFLTATVAWIALLLSPALHAATLGEITEVRRNITLANDEIPVKDFYIKITEGTAIKKNMLLKAVRKLEAKDQGQKKVSDFSSTVALLKVLYVEGNVAIAREQQKVPRTEQPMLEQIGVMMGDTVEPVDSAGSGSKKDSSNASHTPKNKKSLVAKNSAVRNKIAATGNRAPASVTTTPAKATSRGPASVVTEPVCNCSASAQNLDTVTGTTAHATAEPVLPQLVDKK